MKTKLWIARDKDGSLYLYSKKPIKDERMFVTHGGTLDVLQLDKNSHPEITWENSPQRIEI